MEQVLFQTSLIAAFVGGMVALFAPCCISFLLPAYLGSVVKEREKVVLMTLVFGLGIFIVMMPAVLGVAALSKALFIYHDNIYFSGGIVMLISAAITFLGLKLPVPHLPGRDNPQKPDILSIFTLGIFSGITSACCAPVLIGILTLTFLSTNFFGALAIGGMYVLGMVTPLLFISVFLSGKITKFSILRKPVTSFRFLGKERVVIASNLIASIIFAFTGFMIIYLNATGRLGMGDVKGFTKMITNSTSFVSQYVGTNSPLNTLFVIGIAYAFYRIAKRV
ncbi:MAG: cytochrome c biogenesis protein CcdA [Patescibacteria group bacterium]|nr:cytochrome c biogenesis protein CcdA [Patescibacteria group bacterium]MCL6096650.1 cytochrome c biogenesis protein CcdA [Patescibacteria group bacterium]